MDIYCSFQVSGYKFYALLVGQIIKYLFLILKKKHDTCSLGIMKDVIKKFIRQVHSFEHGVKLLLPHY